MKKMLLTFLSLIIILTLSACGGDVKNTKITEYSSDIYTEKEINDAINVTIDYFKKEFSGCSLTQITYKGDEYIEDYQDWASRNNADEVIVLVSEFTVDASGGDGSLNPNSTYIGWNWILTRNNGEKWRHVDHGY